MKELKNFSNNLIYHQIEERMAALIHSDLDITLSHNMKLNSL